MDPGKENLYRTLGTTLTDQLVASVSPLTPEQRQALEYMSKIRALKPDVKEVKRSSLPASCKFLGNMDKFVQGRSRRALPPAASLLFVQKRIC